MSAIYSRSEHLVSLECLAPGDFNALWTVGSQSNVWPATILHEFHFGENQVVESLFFMWLGVPNPVTEIKEFFCSRWLDKSYLHSILLLIPELLKRSNRAFLGMLGCSLVSYWLIHLLQKNSCHSWKRIPLITAFLRPFCSLLSDFSASPRARLCKALVLSVWSVDQQHWHHLGTCWNYKLLGPFYDLLSQNLHVTWLAGISRHIKVWEAC